MKNYLKTMYSLAFGVGFLSLTPQSWALDPSFRAEEAAPPLTAAQIDLNQRIANENQAIDVIQKQVQDANFEKQRQLLRLEDIFRTGTNPTISPGLDAKQDAINNIAYNETFIGQLQNSIRYRQDAIKAIQDAIKATSTPQSPGKGGKADSGNAASFRKEQSAPGKRGNSGNFGRPQWQSAPGKRGGMKAYSRTDGEGGIENLRGQKTGGNARFSENFRDNSGKRGGMQKSQFMRGGGGGYSQSMRGGDASGYGGGRRGGWSYQNRGWGGNSQSTKGGDASGYGSSRRGGLSSQNRGWGGNSQFTRGGDASGYGGGGYGGGRRGGWSSQNMMGRPQGQWQQRQNVRPPQRQPSPPQEMGK
ncbi:MAG: hypothetical protein ACRC12_02190 [Holosporales bacterium]